MKRSLVICTFLMLVSCTQKPETGPKLKRSLVQYVNPLMGIDSDFNLSNGNTYPAIATPWGMNFWTPMISKMGDGWTYKYRKNKIRGIKQTHQPSPWINDYAASYYGFTIQEIREMQIVNMRNYAHGNQPIQHMIYLYNYAKQPWKTQEKVREVLTKLYTPAPDGYCGDEDNGQTSAWYVFGALGFYPVAPATNQFIIGSPPFDEITLHLQNNNNFTIKAKNNNKKNFYIRAATLNGEEWNKSWMTTETVQNGGERVFTMGSEPNKNRAVSEDAVPFSLTNKRSGK